LKRGERDVLAAYTFAYKQFKKAPGAIYRMDSFGSISHNFVSVLVQHQYSSE
jgi:hypothetical protein